MDSPDTETISRFRLGWQVLNATLDHGFRYPLTQQALLSSMLYFGTRKVPDRLDSYFIVTHRQAQQFLKGSWEYTERNLRLLQKANGFPLNLAGVKKLSELNLRIQALPRRSLEHETAQIYEDPLFPIFQHIGQAFRNQVTGRWSFIFDALASLEYPPHTFCDVGCGAGIILGDVLEHYPRIQATGVDVSRAVLSHAKRVLEAWGMPNQIRLIQGDIRWLPLPGNQFDFVIAMEILEHIPDPQRGVSALARILAPDGWLVTSVPINNPTPLHISTFTDVAEVVQLHRQAGLKVARQQVILIAPDILNAVILAHKEYA